MRSVLCSLFIIIFHFSYSQPKLMLPVGHTSTVVSAKYSNDGKFVVTASWDNTAKIWGAADGKLLSDLKGHAASLNFAAFSNNGKLVITTSKDSTAKIWNAKNGLLLNTLRGHKDWLGVATFTKDDKLVATSSWDGTIKVWNVFDGRLLFTLKGHTDAISEIDISTDNKYILSSSKDNTAKIWQLSTGKLIHTLKDHKDWVANAKFSKDNQFVITSSYDNNIIIWKTSDGTILKKIKAHSKPITSLVLSVNNNYFATASLDNSIKLWSLPSGELIKTFTQDISPISSLAISPDEQIIAAGLMNGNINAWNIKSGVLIQNSNAHSGSINDIAFNSFNNVVTASADNTAKIWDVQNMSLLSNLNGHTSVVTSAIFSPDGKYILAAMWDNTAKIWDAYNGKLLYNLKGHKDWVNSAVFSPDGKLVVTASSDQVAKVWDASTGALINELTGHNDWVGGAQFSQSGKYILTTSWDHTIKLWNAKTGEELKEFKGHTDVIKSASFSNDERMIVTASWDNTAKVWDINSGNLVYNLQGHTDKVRSANFSLDDKLILTSSWDSTARIWSLENGKQIKILKEHLESLYSSTYSPDGKRIITSSLDHKAKIWDANTGNFLFELRGHTKPINSVNYSKDGKLILTASWDNTARIWNANNGKLIKVLQGHTASLKSANFSPDGLYIVTTSEDNTLKKWDAVKGELLYTFFAVDSTDYLAIDKDGHYDGTEKARKMLYYVCENEVVDLEQFKELAWEPGLVSKLMKINNEPITAKKVSEINICNATPVIEDKGLSNGKYLYHIFPKAGGVGEVQLFLNGKLIEIYDPSTLPKKQNYFVLALDKNRIEEYFVSDATNQLLVKATTKSGTMTSRGTATLFNNDKKASIQPKMYVISIGVSQYKGENLKLKYAAKDAIDFSAMLTSSARKLLNTNGKENVFLYSFHTENNSNRWPAKQAVQKLIDTIAIRAKPDDILVIFFAGHGILKPGEKNFYLLTSEASAFEIADVEKDVAISTDELKNWLRRIKANKQILILDACNSGQAINNLQDIVNKREVPADQLRALESLKDKTGTFILAASAPGQTAYEDDLYSQGLLTYSLLLGIKLGAGLKNNKFIDVNKWFNFASDNVRNIGKETKKTQEPQILGNASFDIGIVDKEIIDNINLSLKSIFRRSTFIQDKVLLDDELELSQLIDKELMNVSDKGKQSPLAFVADHQFLESYTIRGNYTVSQNSLKVDVFLIKGHKEIKDQFSVEGTVDKKEELAFKIVDKIQKGLK